MPRAPSRPFLDRPRFHTAYISRRGHAAPHDACGSPPRQCPPGGINLAASIVIKLNLLHAEFASSTVTRSLSYLVNGLLQQLQTLMKSMNLAALLDHGEPIFRRSGAFA